MTGQPWVGLIFIVTGITSGPLCQENKVLYTRKLWKAAVQERVMNESSYKYSEWILKFKGIVKVRNINKGKLNFFILPTKSIQTWLIFKSIHIFWFLMFVTMLCQFLHNNQNNNILYCCLTPPYDPLKMQYLIYMNCSVSILLNFAI